MGAHWAEEVGRERERRQADWVSCWVGFSPLGWFGSSSFSISYSISISYFLSNSTQLFEFKNNFEFKHLCTQTNKTNASACMHKQVSPKNKF